MTWPIIKRLMISFANLTKTVTFSVDKSLKAFPKLELVKIHIFVTAESKTRVPGFGCQVPGAAEHVARDYVSRFRDPVQRHSVKNFHIKNILRFNVSYRLILHLNGNYKLKSTFFITLIFSLCNSLNRL